MKIFLSITILISQIEQSFRDSANDAWAIDISQKEGLGKINGVKKLRGSPQRNSNISSECTKSYRMWT